MVRESPCLSSEVLEALPARDTLADDGSVLPQHSLLQKL